VLFVIGGLTASEVRDIHEVASKHNRVNVLVGSTEMISARSALRHIFHS